MSKIQKKVASPLVKKENKSVAITRSYNLDKPQDAVQMAILLKNIVVQQKLFTPIQGKNYVMVEGWQLAGFLTGMNVIVEEPKDLSKSGEIKYSATAKIYKGETLVGVGYAICSSKESKKTKFDEYAILSMAQTRAIGKAYRNKIGFMMKLAGFQSTPGEEMVKGGDQPKEAPTEVNVNIADMDQTQKFKPGQIAGPDGSPTYVCEVCKDPISDTVADYSLKMFKKRLCREHQPNKK